MSRRVLLTGAAGFLGSHALRHLLTHTDWHLVCPVSFAHKGLPERIVGQIDQDAWWDRISVVTCDLACPINDTTAARFGHLDYIINYASQSHVDRSIADPAPFVTNNINLMVNLLEYARSLPLGLFVQISTDEVYGSPPVGTANREWDPTIPSNPYSASKAAQEALAISYWRTYHLPLTIVNCMNLIGEMQDPEKFVPNTIGKILRGEMVDVHASPDGVIGSRHYLHARNLADAVLFLIRRGQTARYPQADRPDRWNVVGEREVTNLEMAQLIATMLGHELRYQLVDFHTHRPGHDLRYALDGTKLADTGWAMPLPLEDSLRTLVKWTVEHPLWADRRPA